MHPPTGPSGRPVYLHVGAPKTGTTNLQQRLRLNADNLADHGLFVPRGTAWDRPGTDLHFRAALDLLGQDWGGLPGHAQGAWPRLVRQVRRQRGTAVISHEVLAPAPPGAIERVRADLAGREIHVIYTARDLARALPAAWQESLKQGRAWTFRKFLARARRGRLWFMRSFDLPRVLQAWGADLPPEHVHLVVMPRPGAEPELLWQRFCQALQLDPAAAPRRAHHTNASLGVPEAQLLRLLNRRVGGRAHRRDPRYHHLVSNLVAEKVLVHRQSPRVQLPPGAQPWVGELTAEWSEWVRRSGIDVIGDLDELAPAPTDAAAWMDPDRLRPRQTLGAALDALVATVDEAAARKRPLPERVRKRVTQRWVEED
ncbi:MAG: hypothetical protein ACRDPH_06090 [Marmoricola sp.]